jgi:hypothetical protein
MHNIFRVRLLLFFVGSCLTRVIFRFLPPAGLPDDERKITNRVQSIETIRDAELVFCTVFDICDTCEMNLRRLTGIFLQSTPSISTLTRLGRMRTREDLMAREAYVITFFWMACLNAYRLLTSETDLIGIAHMNWLRSKDASLLAPTYEKDGQSFFLCVDPQNKSSY